MNNKEISYSVGILAGGKSSRMGKNKALLEFESKTFIGRITGSFEGMEVIISASDSKEYEDLGLKTVTDENNDIGPIEGIRQVLKASSNEYVFVCACDMPFVNRKIADYMAGYISSDYDIYVITDEKMMHPLCAIYSRKLLPIIEELIRNGDYRLRFILENARTKYISLEDTVFDKKTVRNVNTKEEYRELKLPVIFAVSGYKDSGKTWLISELINEFIKEGLSVGVIKHDGHDLIAEEKGTDTFRYSEAGAMVTAVFSDSRYVISGSGKETAEDLTGYMRGKENPPQIIILEGFKSSSYPKIVLGKDGVFPPVDESTVILKIKDRIAHEDVPDIFGVLKKRFDL